MRVRPGILALLVGVWGLALLLLGRHGGASPCSVGSCTTCGLCFRPSDSVPAVSQDDRIG